MVNSWVVYPPFKSTLTSISFLKNLYKEILTILPSNVYGYLYIIDSNLSSKFIV